MSTLIKWFDPESGNSSSWYHFTRLDMGAGHFIYNLSCGTEIHQDERGFTVGNKPISVSFN